MNGTGGWFRKFETALDNAQSGPLWLKDERIVKEVAESLRYRDGKVYRLDAYCIMANHVHAVFAPLAIQPSGEAQTNRLRYRSPRRSVRNTSEWDGRGVVAEHVPSRIYFYQVRANNMYRPTRKMVILK